MLIQKYNPIIFSFVICTALFCADTPNDIAKLTTLMNATYEDFAKMDMIQTIEAQEILEQYVTNTEQGFLNEPLIFGLSRRTLSRSVEYLAGGLFTAGLAFDATEGLSHCSNLAQEVICGIREADTCSTNEHGLLPIATVVSGACSGLLLKLSAQISMHPAERQLQVIERVGYAKIKARIHQVISQQR